MSSLWLPQADRGPWGTASIPKLALNALLMALWRRQPKVTVTLHSDQGCQFTSHDWQGFLRDHNLVSSMSRRGNCHDNAVVESFFQLLKRERIRRQIYSTRDEARADVFNYIECSITPGVATTLLFGRRCVSHHQAQRRDSDIGRGPKHAMHKPLIVSMRETTLIAWAGKFSAPPP